jgi:hypothetical protein
MQTTSPKSIVRIATPVASPSPRVGVRPSFTSRFLTLLMRSLSASCI